MTNSDFLASIPSDVSDRDLIVDGNIIYMSIFLYRNLIPDDVEHISIEDAQRVIDLRIGQSIFINLVEVKRIK